MYVGLPGGSVVRNPPANAGDPGVVVSIPGSRRSPGEAMALHSSALAWKIPWTEELAGEELAGKPMGPQSRTRPSDWAPRSRACASPVSAPPPLPPLVTVSLFSTSVTLFLFCKFICTTFLDSTYKRYHGFVSDLTFLSMRISRSVPVTANGVISLFLWLSNIPLCIGTASFLLECSWFTMLY